MLHRFSKETGYVCHKDIAEVRTLLGLGTWREQMRFWSTTGALLLVGLLTTAMVAGVTSLYTTGPPPCFHQGYYSPTD